VKPVRRIRIFLLIGGLVLAAGLFMGYFFFQPPEPEPLPHPNGYDDFVAAGEMLKGEVPGEKTGTLEECRQFVSANREALARGRLGLAKECRVPTEYSSTWLQRHLNQIMATRKLGHAFCVEGELAMLEKRPGDAASNYLTVIKMGARLGHGGLMIDGLIATACEEEGAIFLEPEVGTLDIEQSRKLIAELEKVESEQEPSAQIIKHEKKWVRAVLRSFDGIKMFVSEAAATRSLNPAQTEQKNFLARYEARLQWALQLKAKLAARAYALEQGRLSASWNDLVPAYLKSVPNVPFGPGDTNRLSFKAD
jgi:hypothetical protein